jgi:hypothetical protein
MRQGPNAVTATWCGDGASMARMGCTLAKQMFGLSAGLARGCSHARAPIILGSRHGRAVHAGHRHSGPAVAEQGGGGLRGNEQRIMTAGKG